MRWITATVACGNRKSPQAADRMRTRCVTGHLTKHILREGRRTKVHFGMRELSHFLRNAFLDAENLCFVTLIKSPLLNSFCADQACVLEYLQVLAGGGLTHAQFSGDEDAAHPIAHQVSVDLRRKMHPRIFEPIENPHASRAGEGLQGAIKIHIDN